MLSVVDVNDKKLKKRFLQFAVDCYSHVKQYRKSHDFVIRCFLDQSSELTPRGMVKPFLIVSNGKDIGRFMVIQDPKYIRTIFIAFFECCDGYPGVVRTIEQKCRDIFESGYQLVYGINGHFFFSSGFLVDHFADTPVFGINYSHPYYHNLFAGYKSTELVTYRLSLTDFNADPQAFSKIFRQKKLMFKGGDYKNWQTQLQRITCISNIIYKKAGNYREINPRRDIEYFNSLKPLIGENQVSIVEHNGRNTGYCIWIPDINEMLTSKREMNLIDIARMKITRKIKGCRILRFGFKEHHKQGFLMADGLLREALANMKEQGYHYVTCGPLATADTRYNHIFRYYQERWCKGRFNRQTQLRIYHSKI